MLKTNLNISDEKKKTDNIKIRVFSMIHHFPVCSTFHLSKLNSLYPYHTLQRNCPKMDGIVKKHGRKVSFIRHFHPKTDARVQNGTRPKRGAVVQNLTVALQNRRNGQKSNFPIQNRHNCPKNNIPSTP